MRSLRLIEFLEHPLAEGVPERFILAKNLCLAWKKGKVANPEIVRLKSIEDLNFLSHMLGLDDKSIDRIFFQIQRYMGLVSYESAANLEQQPSGKPVSQGVAVVKALGDISLYEFLMDCETSTRLNHCVRANAGLFERVGAKEFHDYDQASQAQCLRHVSNLGKKTVAEIRDLITASISGVRGGVPVASKTNSDEVRQFGSRKRRTPKRSPLPKRARRRLQLEAVVAKLRSDAKWPSIKLLEDFVEIAVSVEDKDIIAQSAAGKTLEEIGSQYCCTRERVRQRKKKAIDGIGAFLGDDFAGLAERFQRIMRKNGGRLAAAFIKIEFDATTCSDVTIFIFANLCLGSIKSVDGLLVSSSFESTIASDSEHWESLWSSFTSKNWPVSINSVLSDVRIIDENVAMRLLASKRNVVFDKAGFVLRATLNRSEEVGFALRSIGGKGNAAGICLAISQLFGIKRSERNVRATIGRMIGILLIGRGTYALRETIDLDEKSVEVLRDNCAKYLDSRAVFVSTQLLCREFYSDLKASSEPAYLLYSLLQDDPRFLFSKGLMVSTKSAARKGARKLSLTDQIVGFLKDYRGLNVARIEELLFLEGRVVKPVNIRNVLETSESIVRVERGKFSLKSQVIGSDEESFFLCAEILLFNSQRSVFDLANKMSEIPALWGVRPLNEYVVKSLLDMHPAFAVSGGYCKLISPTSAVMRYMEEGVASDSKLAKLDPGYEVLKRLHASDSVKESEEVLDVLDDIFGAFEKL